MPIKYLLAAVCVLGGCAIGVRPRVLIASVALGCVLSATLALWQFLEVGKASGHTNAIRFGDIAVLMGIWCIVFAAVPQFSKLERMGLLGAGCMGVLASLLSLSRGGWPLLLVAPLVFVWGGYRDRLNPRKLLVIACSVCAAMVLLGAVVKDIPFVHDRVELATEQASGYFTDREKYVGTSVGIRLEQWRMSWDLGLEKPLTGWGDRGVWDGRKQYVQRGEVDASALQIAHTHNEFLEIWARRGLVGVLCLALIYLVPLWIFVPRNRNIPKSSKSLYTALCVAGMMVPIGYFIFGLSEVFFFLNIGNIFFIFSLALLLAAIKWIEREAEKP